MATGTLERPKRGNTRNDKGLPEAFSRTVCQRLRKIALIMNQAETKRARAFKNRDEIQTKIDECSKDQRNKLQELKAEHFDECNEIKRLDAVIKASKDRILETIENADQQEFLDWVDSDPTAASLLNESPPDADEKKEGEDNEDDDEDDDSDE
jgi:hypothetical protein